MKKTISLEKFVLAFFIFLGIVQLKSDERFPKNFNRIEHRGAASWEFMEYSSQECVDQVMKDLVTWTYQEELSERLADIQCLENVYQKDTFFLWAMGGGLFEKLTKEYSEAELLLVGGFIPLDENGYNVKYVQGIGIEYEGKIKMLAPSRSKEEVQIMDMIETTRYYNFSEISETQKESIHEWNDFATKAEGKRTAILESTLSPEEECYVLEKTNSYIIGKTSLLFIEFLSDHFSSCVLEFLHDVKEMYLRGEKTVPCWRIQELKNQLLSPCRMSLFFKMIKRKCEIGCELFFYKESINFEDYNLFFGAGFIIKERNKVERRFPLASIMVVPSLSEVRGTDDELLNSIQDAR
ncbi:MAG: hypothetical protein ACI4SG_01715 [Oligosphaeraceae bacterium]